MEQRSSARLARVKPCMLSSLSGGLAGAVDEVLDVAPHGLIEKSSDLNWRVINYTLLDSFVPMLQANQLYRTQTHQGADSVKVVFEHSIRGRLCSWKYCS